MSKEKKPLIKKDGLTFFPVPKFSDSDVAFGAQKKDYFKRFNLPYVPSEYKTMGMKLFFSGGAFPEGISEKVDRNDAIRYLNAMLSSFEPSHESKEATVGYALWVWHNDDILK